MGEDFNFMKKNRQEWKKQLDARFQDIERFIASNLERLKAQSSIFQVNRSGQQIRLLPLSINSIILSSKRDRNCKIASTNSQN